MSIWSLYRMSIIFTSIVISEGLIAVSSPIRPPTIISLNAASNSNDVIRDWEDGVDKRSEINLRLVNALVEPETPLSQVFLVGKSEISTPSRNEKIQCLALSKTATNYNNKFLDESPVPCLMIPVSPRSIKLLSFVVQNKSLSKSVLLTLNPLLINRDGALFDNIPWSTWTVDPQLRNRDYSNKPIDPLFHLGKRDAFARFGGKDWKGRSVSIGNLALRLKYLIEQDEEPTANDIVLAKRILAIQIKEMQDELAEIEYELAVARNNHPTDVANWEQKKQECLEGMQTMEEKLRKMMVPSASSPSKKFISMFESILNQIANYTTRDGENAAPYRGAMGYAPMLDKEDDIDAGVMPFVSPFGLMREILKDQCKAEVIGAILENTSILKDNTLTLGGAIILRRIPAEKKVTISNLGDLPYTDENEDYGNEGIKGGQIIIVECDVDEAIGMASTYGVPLQVENEIWETASFPAKPIVDDRTNDVTSGVYDVLCQWEPEKELSMLIEGESSISPRNTGNNMSTLRIPKSSSSLYDSMFETSDMETSSGSSSLFPTDNPIQSLEEYDGLDISQKAQILLSLSNFNGKLPRPRVIRNNKKRNSSTDKDGSTMDALDELLIPRIDESVRSQFLIRDAEYRKDDKALTKLVESKSKRQQAKEQAQKARENGDLETALAWDSQAEFYAGLRADITQDEGSYSKLMDKDEWYEKNRLARVKNTDKKDFGTLSNYLD